MEINYIFIIRRQLHWLKYVTNNVSTLFANETASSRICITNHNKKQLHFISQNNLLSILVCAL